MKKQKPFPRGHGILLPVFSLNGKYGIGTFGDEAKSFIDFLSRAGCNMWQILPLGPTGFGNSPYQCFSAFAGGSDPLVCICAYTAVLFIRVISRILPIRAYFRHIKSY